MTTYATQMWWLMMIAFVVGSLVSLLIARVLLPNLKTLKSYDAAPEAGDQT